ncbi:A disintegrin and metalloproteinase with thrombospondin motifs 3 isoform X2 [Exaiptasia diaphana]|uniref:Uncharacterized protein n=1 Tax=Exaiptasia diaphana TaxID=2652724 RepID=A0A913XUA8_EXADI|nr:A disintegrin and metalloproteinase with thrombospondin motifs 3 isoform X2 [Exaiptasia diaphana]
MDINYIVVLYGVCLWNCMVAVALQTKIKASSASNHQEQLLQQLTEYEIDYPIETNPRGRYIRHVTSVDYGRRIRRSLDVYEGPVYYNVRYRGKDYRMKLRPNEKLLGQNFTVERFKKGGDVERTKFIEHCYLVGETTGFNLSAAISDCDGLSGAIETPDDILFIEPIINENAVKTKKKGKPHLIYRQSVLKKIQSVAFDMHGDLWKPLYAKGNSDKKQFEFRGAKAFIRVVNSANRPVKVLYLDGDKEKLFANFPINDDQGINTFTSHRWLVRDTLTNKRLLIDGKKLYAPKANSAYERKTVYITIPKGLKLPKVRTPDPPNSYLKVINRSGRFIQIFYHDTTSTKKTLFTTAAPGDVVMIKTYTAHRWTVTDYDTGKPLWLNTRYILTPIKSDEINRMVVLATVPLNLILPKTKYPDMHTASTKHIEAMVTADSSVVKHHGKDKVERYILTLMNIVSRIFHHPSLGVKIDLTVTRLAILEENPKGVEITRSPVDSLNKVCKWGHEMRKGWDKTSKKFHDQTIFLTRSDFGPSGYAPVASMCYRTKSCTLNEDDGFPSSFIVAHETGHTLGMEHDGFHNNCTKDTLKGSVMAPLVRSKFDRFYWSACSRRELIDHFHALWCLDDKPHQFNRTLMQQLPGQIYSLDEQCKMDFGNSFSSCKTPYERKKCSKLWCDEYTYSSWCRTRNTPPLEGTTCGERMWCRYGHCVPMTKDGSFVLPTLKPTPKPVNGDWSKWSAFGPCSMTCGQGIKIRARACNAPKPRYGGLPCKGSAIDVSFCNSKPCSSIPPTYDQIRYNQCEQRGTKKEWVFYDVYDANLDCDFENGLCGWEQDDHDNFDWTPASGKTPSSNTGPGYDHTLGPGKKGTYLFIETSRPTDVGWRARLISQLVAKHVTCLSFWYHAFGDDDHFGDFEVLINTTKKEKMIWGHSGNKGNKWFQKHVTILSVTPYRVVFQGIRGDGYRADVAIDDIKFTDGPCHLDISPPLDDSTNPLEIPMELCKTYCISTKTRNIFKFRVQDGARCYENPAILDVCVKGRCQVVGCDGKIGSKMLYDNCGICDGINDTCTLKKGKVELLSEKDEAVVLKCPVGASNIMVESLSTNKHHLVVESVGEIPETLINGGANMSEPGVYSIGGTEFVYSRNNKTEKILALGPIKEHLVVKVKNSGKELKTKLSGSVKYQYYKPNKQPTIYKWKSLGWTNCSKPCGGGFEERILECRREKDNVKVKKIFCFGVTQPKPTSRECNLHKCPINFHWKTHQWQSCSVTCSEGTRRRRVFCERSTYGQKPKQVLNYNCKGKKPPTTEKCVRKVCEAMWVPGPWGKCSKTCGRGVRTRNVKCLSKDGKPSWKCTERSKLPTKGHCDMITCVPDVPVVLGNLSCTFEAGFCRWRNTRKEDQFNWLVGRGTTKSRYTGPNTDNTFGTKKRKIPLHRSISSACTGRQS